MNWFLGCYKKYASFSGRASRTEYWMFSLFYFIVYVVLMLIWVPLANLYVVGSLIPALAVNVRRLHDTNRSGGYWFLGLIPLVGSIVIVVFCCQKGTTGQNQYGADPLAVEDAPCPPEAV